jgi:putative phosphoribosyl transferase
MLLERSASGAAGAPAPAGTAGHPPILDEEVELRLGTLRLAGHFTVPEALKGMVVFAHGSGSSRHSPRNRFVASVLNEAGLGTLLFDLLGADEERDRSRVFDIPRLADRLERVTGWLAAQPESAGSRIGYFGASTGAAAALWAAASMQHIAAVVSRGGRPDLALSVLGDVRAPTLLIVGGHDDVVLDLNRRAQDRLGSETRLVVVPGATHLFDEPGALEEVAHLARDWFVHHLAPLPHPRF